MVFDPHSAQDGRPTGPSDSQQSALLGAVAALEAAVTGLAEDPDGGGERFDAALRRLGGLFGPAGEAESAAVGPRLAALLQDTPLFPRAHLAMMVGACVERGADPVACADGVLAGLREALSGALLLIERWAETGADADGRSAGSAAGDHGDGDEDGDEDEDPLPDPDREDPGRAHARITEPGRTDGWHAHRAVAGWWTLQLWQQAAFALCTHAAVRRAARDSGVGGVLTELIDRYRERSGRHDLKGLRHLAATLDDEPLLVLHRASGTGYLLRMDGLTDNFQLHTLLIEVLVGGGHLPGTRPDPEVVALSRTRWLDGRRFIATGAFNLVAPDGGWIWNEGMPADIPVVDGVRTLVLDPQPYERSWAAGRFVEQVPGDLRLERVLAPAEAAARLAAAAPALPFEQAVR
ncbi:hypothetical protein [Kitasatospora purpeofusca]|uniref:hypothetical protein n=1 Tax=Kitasatospora purpeofusca TaxID=67352 RepID=UPI002A5ADAEC|nr:hypothetical protein [Kitasatospora purpeofusca]MDY0812952.1 hypothetical protein [Kitasatospora purpeofusca]